MVLLLRALALTTSEVLSGRHVRDARASEGWASREVHLTTSEVLSWGHARASEGWAGGEVHLTTSEVHKLKTCA